MPNSVTDALSGMLNVFIDPAATARQIPRQYSWLWPLLIVAIVTAIVGYMMIPFTVQVMLQNPPDGVSPEQLQRSMGMIQTTQKIGAFATPILIGGMLALIAAIAAGMCALLGVRTSFRDLFSLLAHCSLITMLQTVAGYFVVRAKGDEVQSMEQLRPAFGLDLAFSEGLSKPVHAILNYFSIFTIWYIVMFVLTLAALTGATRTKAFLASIPVCLIPMLFYVGFSALR